jgi:hypothetical protein
LSLVKLFLAQIMARAGARHLVSVQSQFSVADFKRAYLRAPPGLFAQRAWAYWGLILFDDPSRPLPELFPGANRFN